MKDTLFAQVDKNIFFCHRPEFVFYFWMRTGFGILETWQTSSKIQSINITDFNISLYLCKTGCHSFRFLFRSYGLAWVHRLFHYNKDNVHTSIQIAPFHTYCFQSMKTVSLVDVWRQRLCQQNSVLIRHKNLHLCLHTSLLSSPPPAVCWTLSLLCCHGTPAPHLFNLFMCSY